MKGLIRFIPLLAVLLAALFVPPASAQVAPVPAFSFQRVSLGLTVEHVWYDPPTFFAGIRGGGEVKVALPVAYNLGRYSSLQGKLRRGIESRSWEYSAGLTFHILARGGKP